MGLTAEAAIVSVLCNLCLGQALPPAHALMRPFLLDFTQIIPLPLILTKIRY